MQTLCKKCGKETGPFTQIGYWVDAENTTVSLCESCSQKVKDFIEGEEKECRHAKLNGICKWGHKCFHDLPEEVKKGEEKVKNQTGGGRLSPNDPNGLYREEVKEEPKGKHCRICVPEEGRVKISCVECSCHEEESKYELPDELVGVEYTITIDNDPRFAFLADKVNGLIRYLRKVKI